MLFRYLIAFLILLQQLSSAGQNPIIQGYADPAMRVYNGKMYMLIGKDKSPDVKSFTMPYWSIISSTDLQTWKMECHIDPKNTYLGEGYNKCWAGDIISHNGKYYCYFSEGGEASGVLVADKPEGPYVDVLKKSLLPKEMSENKEYDATAFTDDNGEKYLTFGRDGFLNGKIIHYQIAKLNNDMLSLAEAPRDLVTAAKFGFGDAGRARDHSYFHKHGNLYYLSCANVYATSKNIYGPYSELKNTGGPLGHSSYADYNGQSYLAWENTCDPFGNRAYRQVMMTYFHYTDRGEMVVDVNFIKGGKHYEAGVGNYRASWDSIQAEWFFKKSDGLQKKQSPDGGFEIQNSRNNDFLNFPSMKDMPQNATISFNLSSKRGGGKIEVRQGSPTGTLLGTCRIPKTGSWATYQMIPCNLKNPGGNNNLFFVFKGDRGELARLDFFTFQTK